MRWWQGRFLHLLSDVPGARLGADGQIPRAAPGKQFFRIDIHLNRIETFVLHRFERFRDMHKPVIIGVLKVAPVR